MLPVCRGNYRASEIWSGFTPINLSSRTPSTHSPRTGLSCCQRWLGRPYLICLLRQLRYCSSKNKNHPTDRQSVSLVRITLAVISCRFGCGWWSRTTNCSVWDCWDTISLIRDNKFVAGTVCGYCLANNFPMFLLLSLPQNWRLVGESNSHDRIDNPT